MNQPGIQLNDRFHDDDHGSIVFRVPGDDGSLLEVMRFNPLGDVWVRGEKVDDNKQVYDHFRAWLATAIQTRTP